MKHFKEGDIVYFYATGYKNGKFSNKKFLQYGYVTSVRDNSLSVTDEISHEKCFDFIRFDEIIEHYSLPAVK